MSKTKVLTDDNKLRVLRAKAKLPKNYLVLMIHYYPEIEHDKYIIEKIRNIMTLRVFDEDWVQKIEHVADCYKNA